MLRIEDLPPLHDRKRVEKKLVHAGPKRLHARKRSFLAGDEPIEVSSDSRIMLQTRQRRHIKDLPQSRPASVGHALMSADALSGIASRGIGPRQFDELPAVPVFVDRADVGQDAGGR